MAEDALEVQQPLDHISKECPSDSLLKSPTLLLKAFFLSNMQSDRFHQDSFIFTIILCSSSVFKGKREQWDSGRISEWFSTLTSEVLCTDNNYNCRYRRCPITTIEDGEKHGTDLGFVAAVFFLCLLWCWWCRTRTQPPLSCTQEAHSLSLRYIVSPRCFLTISLPTRKNMSRSKSCASLYLLYLIINFKMIMSKRNKKKK